MHNKLKVLKKKAEAEMEMHLENAQTYLDNPAGIGEHPDIMEALLEIGRAHV